MVKIKIWQDIMINSDQVFLSTDFALQLGGELVFFSHSQIYINIKA